MLRKTVLRRTVAITFALFVGACSSAKTIPVHPGTVYVALRTAYEFQIGNRVIDPTNPRLQGTVTSVPDSGHHWLQSPLRVEWDDGDYTEWSSNDGVPLEVVGHVGP